MNQRRKVVSLTVGQDETCCFTGHRTIPHSVRDQLSGKVRETVDTLYKIGFRNFRCGGARGFDTLAAEIVLAYRNTHPDARLVMILPCRDQASHWEAREVLIYDNIRRQADEVAYVSEEYTPECMFTRNRALVDGSSVCVAYMNAASGGTAYTVKYAMQRGLIVKNLGAYQLSDDQIHLF